MFRVCLCTLMLACGVFLVSGGLTGQEAKKDDKKDPPVKVKGMLPPFWGMLGLSDEQRQNVYRIQAKYNGEIEKLEAKIADLRTTRDKEMKAVLTEEQQKRLIDLKTGKGK